MVGHFKHSNPVQSFTWGTRHKPQILGSQRNPCICHMAMYNLSDFSKYSVTLPKSAGSDVVIYQCQKERAKSHMMYLRRIKTIACEVYRSLHNLKLPFMKDMFSVKEGAYDLLVWDSHRHDMQRSRKMKYGWCTFSYYGAHIWNVLPPALKNVHL